MKITEKQYLNLLRDYPVRQFPLAGRFIVNQMAFEARKIAVKEIDKRFIIRNKFVTGRTQFQMAPATKNIREIKSEMGALEEIDFMRDQEDGFTLKPQRGSKLMIPTRGARISKVISKRKRKVYYKNQLGNLRKPSQYKGKSKKQKIIAMLQDMARKKDKRAAIVPWPNKPGIYEVKNVRRKGSGKSRFQFKMNKLYDLSKRSQAIKARPWMLPTLRKIIKREERIAEVAWQRFLSRL